MVTSRGNILHVMDVIEEHCTLYKLLDLGFICTEKCSSENKEAVNAEGVLMGKQADAEQNRSTNMFKRGFSH